MSSFINKSVLIALMFCQVYLQANSNNKNIVYIELLGECVFYSINYERKLIDINYFQSISGHIGFEYAFHNSNHNVFNNDFLLPISLQYLIGSQKHKGEIGIGIVSWNSISQNDINSYQVLSYSIGYRYQCMNDKLLLRMAFEPIIVKEYLPYIALGVGISFK